MIPIRLAVCLLAALCYARSVSAQPSANVPADDPVYHVLDILAAHGLLEDLLYGQRPFTRREIVRLLNQAERRQEERAARGEGDAGSRAYVGRLLDRFTPEYAAEMGRSAEERRFAAYHSARYRGYATSAAPRRIPEDNGLNFIEGVVGSFDAYQNGRVLSRGITSFFETQHAIRLSRYGAVWLEPQAALHSPRGTFLRLYGVTGWKNIALQIGRDDLLWGQGPYGGLMFSSHARPLDMLKVHTPHPFRLPWLFKALGPARLTFFVANLGPEQVLPYPYLYGVKASFRPGRHLEIGLSHTITMGGRGAPSVSFFEPLTELFPIHKFLRNLGTTDTANHLFGLFEFRWTVPPWRSTVLYGEAVFDDSPMRALSFPDNLLNQMSFQTGVYAPRLTSSGSMALRLDYQHLAPWTYRHNAWRSGYTLNGRALGSPLGPAADGLSLALRWQPSPDALGAVCLDYAVYRPDIYGQTPNKYGGNDRVVRVTDFEDEHRFRSVIEAGWQVRPAWRVTAQAGLEHIRRFAFAAGRNRWNGLVGVQAAASFSRPGGL
jgi:hypothetical protein